jgi:hypothetical protein
MVLRYADGSKTEAFLLARTENKIRVAIPGSDDPLELTDVRGTWISEDCEPVRVEFAWQGKTHEQMITEADCLCSHDLAAHLIHLLWSADEEEPWKANRSAVPSGMEDSLPLPVQN